MRLNESGVGLQGLSVGLNANTAPPSNNRTLTTLANDNSKYTAPPGLLRRAGPPPGRKMTGSIDVIGGAGISSRREDGTIVKGVTPPTKENVIQVMTADRREYSRPGGKFDASVPPPFGVSDQDNFYNEHDPYYNFEPTQEWANNMPMNAGWTPSGIKELTPGPQMVPPPNMGGPQMSGPPPNRQMNTMPPMVGNPMIMNPPRYNMHMNDRDRDMQRENHLRNERDNRDHGSGGGNIGPRDHERERVRDRDREREHSDRNRNDRDRNDRKSNVSILKMNYHIIILQFNQTI